MADQRLTELTKAVGINSTDLMYLVGFQGATTEGSYSIDAQTFLASNSTGVNRVISGQVVWSGTGLTWQSANLVVEANGRIYYSHGQTVTLSNGDGSNPRFDVIFFNESTEDLDKKEGTPAASPTVPNLDAPKKSVATNIVLVATGATSPSEVTLDLIYDENTGPAAEWTGAESTSGARLSLADTSDPINLTKSIKSTDGSATVALNDNDYFEFSDSAVTISEYDYVKLKIKPLFTWKNSYFNVEFYDSTTLVGEARIDRNKVDSKLTTTVQQVYIYDADVQWVDGKTQFTKIRFQANGAFIKFIADEIYVQSTTGSGSTSKPEPNASKAEDIETDTTNFAGNLSTTDTDVQLALDTLDDITPNQTHTGEVTGATTLTVDKTAITNKTLVTAAATDHVVIADASDSDNLKKVLVSDFGVGSAITASGTPVDNQVAVWTNASNLKGDANLTFNAATDALAIGQNDNTDGTIIVYGNTTGSNAGGKIALYTAADHDTTIDFYQIDAFQDDLRILKSDGSTVLVKYDAGNNELYLYDYVETLTVKFSDETTAITTGTGKVWFTMPNYQTTLVGISAEVTTAPTTSALTVDVNEGTSPVSVLSTKITVDATEYSSESAATPPVISDSSLAASARMSVDVDSADSGGTSTGGSVTLYFKRT